VFLGREIPFLDLTGRVREAGLTANMLPQRLGLFSYQDKIYGLPQSVAAVVLYYRQDLFILNKISPADFRTWDQFIKTSKKIKNQSLLAMDWSYFEILLRQRGFDLFDKNGKPTFDSPVAVETLEFLVKLADEGVGLNPDRGNIFDPTFFSGDIANNEVLTIIGAGWYGLDMLRNFTPPDVRGEWRAMPLPVWDDAKSQSKRPTSTFAGQGLLIYKNSKQTDLAWDFIKFIVGDIDANVERFLQGNCFPAFIPAWADLRMSRADTVFGGQPIGSLFMELANQIPEVNQVPMRAMFTNLFRENYWSSLISDMIKPAAALAEIKKEIMKASKR
jgi:ABC-type glycerol-3-phosphate transport system substrate-binding protein